MQFYEKLKCDTQYRHTEALLSAKRNKNFLYAGKIK
jgi:hypothetical protein